MSQIIIKGDLKTTAGLENALKAEFAAQDWGSAVDVESTIEDVQVGPGEMGFGEEIRQVLIGLSEVLKSVPDAAKLLAEGVRNRVTPMTNVRVEIATDGSVVLDLRGAGGVTDVGSVTREVAAVVNAARQGRAAGQTESGTPTDG